MDSLVRIKNQYTQSNFMEMEVGQILLDYALNCNWKVIKKTDDEVILKNLPCNPELRENGVTMSLSKGSFINTFIEFEIV